MFDVIVIGGGPGGYRVAELLGKSKKRVALIEKSEIGGVCLNEGCIPFKHYLHNAHVRSEFCRLIENKFAKGSELQINQEQIFWRKKQIIEELRQSVEAMLKSCGVTLFKGIASVLSNLETTIKVKVGNDIIEGDKLVIATGSVESDFLPLRGNTATCTILNSEKMLEMTRLPENIDIIGGGVIGLEAASYYANAGCEVTIIEESEHIGGYIDFELAEILKKILQKKGIKILTETSLLRFENDKVIYQHGDYCISRNPQFILTSMGRRANIDKSMMNILGVEYDSKGIKIDSSCITSNPNVYACGDATGKLMLAHTAYRQAKVISDSIRGIKSEVNYQIIPRVIYTSPEVVSIGLSEDECRMQKIVYKAKSLPMTYNGKYYAEYGKDGSRAKMIIDEEERIIGFHIIANGVSELSLSSELMMMNKMTIDEICDLTVAHPTYGEIITELAGAFINER